MRNKAKRTLALIMAALVVLSCTPVLSFADEIQHPDANDAKYTEAEVAISAELAEKVAEADKAATEAQEKADAAKKAVDAVSEEVKDVKGNADLTALAVEAIDGKADEAVNTHKEGTDYADKTAKDLAEEVKKTTETINAEADKIAEEKAKAEAAKKAAETAKAEAKKAETVEEAQAAADKAKAEAAKADQAQKDAEGYLATAKTALDEAKAQYEATVKAAQEKIAEYNAKIGNLGGQVTGAQDAMDTAKKNYEAALKEVEEAQKAKEDAIKASEAANEAARTAEANVYNFYVNPLQTEYDVKAATQADAQKVADAASAKVEQLNNAKNTIEELNQRCQYNQSQTVVVNAEEVVRMGGYWGQYGWTPYDAAYTQLAKDRIDSYNKAIAQAVIEKYSATAQYNQSQTEIQNAYERVTQKYWVNAYGQKMYYSQQELATAQNIVNEYEKAQNALNSVNNTVVIWNNNNPNEYKATLANSLVGANAVLADANNKLDAANTEASKAQAALNGAVQTRDEYTKAVKEALAGEDGIAAAKAIVAELQKYVEETSAKINETEYDKDLYAWATQIVAGWDYVENHWYDGPKHMYQSNQINEKYDNDFVYPTNNPDWYKEGDWFWNQWVSNTPIYNAEVAETNANIQKAMDLYREALLKAQEQVAFDNAYIADAEVVAEAQAVAEKAEKAAKDWEDKLTAAQAKLDAAMATYEAAKAKVNALTEITLDLTDAQAKLGEAEQAYVAAAALVEEVKTEVKKANDAKKDADNYLAQKTTGVKFFVLLPNNERPTEGKGNPTGNYTGMVGSMTLDRYDKETAEDGVKINIGSAHTFCLEYVESTAKSADKVSNDSNAVEEILAARCGDYAEKIGDIEKNALNQLEKTYKNLVVTKGGQSYLITGIDWYEVKYTGGAFHCDGEVILAPLKATFEAVTKDTYTNTETPATVFENPVAPIQAGQDPNGTWSEDGSKFTLDAPETVTDADGNVYTLVPGSNVLDLSQGQSQMDVKYVREINTAPKGKKSSKSVSNGEVSLADEEVPLSDLPTEVNLPDGDVPLSDMPEEELPDEEVPLAELPATGGIGMGIFLLVGGALAAAGTGLRRREDDK